jgi:NAD(P)-dependent dehydrogenase (short-subunit alcohol dehydrogenase family)
MSAFQRQSHACVITLQCIFKDVSYNENLLLSDEIVHITGNREVFVKKLDLSSLKSIREFADDINRTVTKLDVLVHNAGTAHTFGPKTTQDGLELTMATNHFGPFLLTHLLIGKSKLVVHFH